MRNLVKVQYEMEVYNFLEKIEVDLEIDAGSVKEIYIDENECLSALCKDGTRYFFRDLSDDDILAVIAKVRILKEKVIKGDVVDEDVLMNLHNVDNNDVVSEGFIRCDECAYNVGCSESGNVMCSVMVCEEPVEIVGRDGCNSGFPFDDVFPEIDD